MKERRGGEWQTELSLVYHARENAVRFVLHGDFETIDCHSFGA